GGLIGALCIGLGGGFMAVLLPRQTPTAIRIWAGLAYVLSTPLWLAMGMETPLWLMLVLAAVWLAQYNRWTLAGLIIGLDVLGRPAADRRKIHRAKSALRHLCPADDRRVVQRSIVAHQFDRLLGSAPSPGLHDSACRSVSLVLCAARSRRDLAGGLRAERC